MNVDNTDETVEFLNEDASFFEKHPNYLQSTFDTPHQLHNPQDNAHQTLSDGNVEAK